MISIKPTKFNTLTKYFNFGQLERPKIKKKEIIIADQNSPAGICDYGVTPNQQGCYMSCTDFSVLPILVTDL